MGRTLKPRKGDGKYMIQILLPSAQGEYYVKYIEDELERKVSSFTKDLILNFIKGVSSKTQYDKLKEQDDKEWRSAVKQRVETRRKTEKLNQSNQEQS